MAIRPVFIPKDIAPFVDEVQCEFKWNGGFALSQKRKNVKAIHDEFMIQFPGSNLLEVSTKSTEGIGVNLSAHNLMKYVPSLDRKVPIECIYHGAKVFTDGGPHTDIYDMPPITVKKYLHTVASGELSCFRFEEKDYPLLPTTAFYDWIYINAVLESPALIDTVINYDGFTDVAYTPGKCMACQARTVAMLVSIYKLNLLDKVKNFDDFIKLVYVN